MKKLLIVVDYQKDFVDGTTPVKGAKEIEGYLYDLITEYRNNGQEVIFTMDTHSDDYFETEEGKFWGGTHCVRGTEGHKIYGKINRLAGGSLVFEKRAFPSSQLCFYLRGQDYDEVTLVGLNTIVSVLSNAVMVKAALPKAHIIIDGAGCCSNDARLEKEAYEIMRTMFFEVKNAK